MERHERDARLAYFILRVSLGINLAMHGLTRLIAGRGIFVASLLKQFDHSVLPRAAVVAFGNTLPFVEAAIGLLILTGLFTRYALAAGGIVLWVLTFGVALIEQWDLAAVQLSYSVAFFFLMFFCRFNALALDNVLQSSKRKLEDRNTGGAPSL